MDNKEIKNLKKLKKKKEKVLYVTSDGDRYHNSLACPGLKRSVRSIPKSEALGKGLRPCGRCAE